MFHWICPECGQEIAPTARECPVCDPAASAAEPTLVGVVETPTAFRSSEKETPAASSLPATPTRNPLVEQRAPVAHAGGKPTPATPPEPLLPQLESWPLPDELGVLAATLELPSSPPPPRVQDRVRMDVPAVPPALKTLLASLDPASRPAPIAAVPAAPAQERLSLRPAAEPPPVRRAVPLARVEPVRRSGRPLSGELPTLPWTPASVLMPGTPKLGLAPNVAPLGHYDPLEGHPMRPARPVKNVHVTECGLRLTVAGPALVPSLIRFKDQALNPIPALPGRFGKRLVPKWLVTAMILGTVMTAGFNSVLSLVTRPAEDVKSEAPAAASETADTSVPAPPPAAAASPLSKAIEVTGVRIQIDPAQKSEIRYLVVNHTAAPISGVTAYVTLRRTSSAPGQAPLARFQFVVPDLGPYRSREMSSSIERMPASISLPEWQDLKADIEIGR